jgi:hypothetical protein
MIWVPPAALACLTWAFRGGSGWRDAFLRAIVAYGAVTVVLTESLSAAHAIRPVPLVIAWTIVCTATLLTYRQQAARPRTPDWLTAAFIAATVLVTAIVGFIAWKSAPNSADAMAYHLPRVFYWRQQEHVGLYASHYYNQLTMPPLAEYLVLNTYMLSGGDHFANMVQFVAYASSAVAVSAIAGQWGLDARSQAFAGLFCVTLPNAILQASGSKNDLVLALWLCAAYYFRKQFVWCGAACGLALLTKGTALIFLPFILIAARPRRIAAVAAIAILLNTPHWSRVYELSGSPLGFRGAHGNAGDPRFHWSPDRISAQSIVSNILRIGSDHLPARSDAWNAAVYEAVVLVHQWLGIDVNDPATTWQYQHYDKPRNSNHEAATANRWHLLFLIVTLFFLKRSEWWYAAALAAAWIGFCATLRYQWFLMRLQTPLFVAAAPLAGRLPRPVMALAAILLVNNARPYLFENWTRRISGPESILGMPRDEQYFIDLAQWNDREMYRKAVDAALASSCRDIGIDSEMHTLEYPFLALVHARRPGVRFRHYGVTNLSARYGGASKPCLLLCLHCNGVAAKREAYRDLGEPRVLDQSLLYQP